MQTATATDCDADDTDASSNNSIHRGQQGHCHTKGANCSAHSLVSANTASQTSRQMLLISLLPFAARLGSAAFAFVFVHLSTVGRQAGTAQWAQKCSAKSKVISVSAYSECYDNMLKFNEMVNYLTGCKQFF